MDARMGELNERMGQHREDINELLEERRGLHSELVSGFMMLFGNIIESVLIGQL